MPDTPLPILVAAFGNEMAADDSFGPLAAEALQAKAPAGVEIISLGMKPAALVDLLDGRRALCVVDAAHCDDLPSGTILEMDFFDPNRPRLVHDHVLSTHGLSVADELRLAKQLGLCPKEVWLVAVVAESVEVGRPIGEAVLRQVPVVVDRIILWAERTRMRLVRADGFDRPRHGSKS